MRGFIAAGVFVVLSLPGASRAQGGVFDELAGVRSAAMGGSHRGVGTSNDTIYLNPAGMSIGRRYAVEFHYGYSPFDGLSHMNTSAVDSKSGPVAGGMAFTHTRGDGDGVDASLNRIYVAAAYPITQAIAFGVTQRYIRGSFTQDGARRKISVFTNDAGLALRFPAGIGIGLSAHNIIRTKVPRMTPLTFAGGIAWNANPITISADVQVNARQREELVYIYSAGAEYFLQGQFPIRLGYRRAPFVRIKNGEEGIENILSGGLGWVSATGALEASFLRSLERPNFWSLMAALKFFI